MKIAKHQVLSTVETLDRLLNTRLKGFGEAFIYRDAKLELIEGCPVTELVPPQRYVLNGTVQTIFDLYKTFKPLGVDIFALRGALLFWTDEMDLWGPPIPFLPPIVEESTERDGHVVKLVNDGMHRTFAAMLLSRNPNVIFVSGLPPEYPYYAYGFEGGWSEVRRTSGRFSEERLSGPRQLQGAVPSVQRRLSRYSRAEKAEQPGSHQGVVLECVWHEAGADMFVPRFSFAK